MTSKRFGVNSRQIVLHGTVVLGIVALLLLGAILYRTLTNQSISPIPESVAERLSFSPLIIPKNNQDFIATSYKFGGEKEGTQVFSFIIKSADGKHSITASEYTQPAEYSEIPEYKNQFLSNIAQQYATVQSSNGTIYLGRKVKQDNKQLGIMLERGLLVFFAPTTGDVDETTWRNLGDALEIQKL